MSNYEQCNLCFKKLSSLTTRNIVGEYYFCAECFDGLVYPIVLNRVEQIIGKYNGETKNDKHRRAEAISIWKPKSQFGGTTNSGSGQAGSDKVGSESSISERTNEPRTKEVESKENTIPENEDRDSEGEGEEAQIEDYFDRSDWPPR